MSSSFGTKIKVTIFGQSHSEGIGVVLDGLPPGEAIDLDRVQTFLDRRAPGKNAYSTPRKEADRFRILSGLFEGKTCGAPLCAVIENTNTRSKDYDKLKDVPRPGHADYTAYLKYGGANDHRGGGHFSGRLTAPLCFAGSVCMQILQRRGITVGAHIYSIYNVEDEKAKTWAITEDTLKAVSGKIFPVFDDAAGLKMQEVIADAKLAEDSVGGIVECFAVGLPPGIGDPMFGGIENRLAAAVFGIPAVKGIEFGAGFEAAKMLGSENNDAFLLSQENDAPGLEQTVRSTRLRTMTNHHGGTLGGISSGMPIVLRAAFKPTPSIGKPQDSVSLSKKEGCELKIEGRHDPCIVPRAVPCVEAAVAIQLLDLMELG